MVGRMKEASISAANVAPTPASNPATSAYTHTWRGATTRRTSVIAAEPVPDTDAILFVANTAAGGRGVVAMSIGMRISPPPPMTASTHPASAAAATNTASETDMQKAYYRRVPWPAMKQWQRWMIVAPASVALGYLLSRLHVPAAWILAGILCSGFSALSTSRELKVNNRFYQFCRGIIGILAALPLIGVPFRDVLPFIVPGLVSAAVIVGIGFVGGMLLSRYGVSQETGVLSMMSGGSSMMPAMAEELGADMRYVALTQYLRLLAVSMTLPLVASIFTPPGVDHLSAPDVQWWMWIMVIVIALVGDPIAKRLHVPASGVFGPLLLTVIVGAFIPAPVAAPQPLAITAFLAIGWVCGGSLSVPALKNFARLLPATITFIVVVMAACAGMGAVVAAWLDITYFEAYLATSPGAIETVLALSAEGGGGPVVVAMQLIRLICIVGFAAALPTILRRVQKYLP